MKNDIFAKVIGIAILFIVGLSLLVQLQNANENRESLKASVAVLQAQVESLGGDPAPPPKNGDPVIIAGERGERGPMGLQGYPGPRGDTGASGATGAQGETGLAGPQGETGATGVQGEPGVPGQQGPAGESGPAGPAGPEGPTGPAGYPTSWTFTFDNSSFMCSDPEADSTYTCTEV
jgi:hypothetical protein